MYSKVLLYIVYMESYTWYCIMLYALEPDWYCRHCNAHKKVKLTKDGLCLICNERRPCSRCGQRSQARYFNDRQDWCVMCDRKENIGAQHFPGAGSGRRT